MRLISHGSGVRSTFAWHLDNLASQFEQNKKYLGGYLTILNFEIYLIDSIHKEKYHP